MMFPPMMAPRQKNLCLVHGWKVDDSVRNSMMMDKGMDAKDMGISLSMSADGKSAFVGKHLGTLDIREGQEYVSILIPSQEDGKALVEAMNKLGFYSDGNPMLYVVAG